MLLGRNGAWLLLIMKLGPRPDAMEPDIHGVRTQWIRGFMAFGLARRHPNCEADGVGVT
jgi:hypothetical protein